MAVTTVSMHYLKSIEYYIKQATISYQRRT